MSRIRFCSLAVLVVLGMAAGSRAEDIALAGRARAVFQTHCVRCHNGEPAKGGFGYVLDRDRLVSRGKVVPGKPGDSPLLKMVEGGEMPPPSQKTRPSADEVTAVRQWIAAGAPGSPRPELKFLADADILRLILADVQSLPTRQRRFARYLTLTHLHNAGFPETEVQQTRQAASKLVNSLSWHPRVTSPHPIDPDRTILRIDLRDYLWNARVWDRLAVVYPYRITRETLDSRTLAAATGTDQTALRADWFVATASRPPFYHDFLQLPSSDRELERLVRVEVLTNWQEERVARAGFNGSGVSRNNRLLERHDAAYGSYWRSYDFSDNTERQNLFEHPLGPLPGQNSFQHAGGELICNLPNGLQAYLLVDANGRRIDRAPVDIVSDPRRPDRTVENGLSCIGCHNRGLIFKADQVRSHVAKNPNAFSRDDIDAVNALYPPEAAFRRLMDDDIERFVAAVVKTGVKADEPEPVSAVAGRYENVLDLAAAAAETGLKTEEFTAKLGASTALCRTLGPLLVKGGTVQRTTFQTAFPDLVREFKLGTDTPLSVAIIERPAARPFTGHTGHVGCVAISPDGKRALSGSDDRALRLWDIATGDELLRLDGHTQEVLSVAFSSDGRRAVSAGRDRAVSVWDLATRKLLRQLTGHTDIVSCAVFSPDGRLVLSCGHDRSVRIWDAASGQEKQRFNGHTDCVHRVAFSPDGRRFLSASADRSVRLVDAATGNSLLRLDGHEREVFAVAFSPDGRRAVSGGADRVVRLWDLGTGKEMRRLEGHVNSIVAVAFTDNGRAILTGSSQYRGADRVLRRWDADSGRELDSQSGREGETIWSIDFAPDGRKALSGGSGSALRVWQLAK